MPTLTIPSTAQAYMQKAKGLTGVYCVALNRPETKNAISQQLLEDLHAAVSDATGNPLARVLIIHSANPSSFCSGADLIERRSMSSAQTRAFLSSLNALFASIADLPFPTIAAIDGPALGGGLEMALCCDIRVAACDVEKIGLPECRLGVIPGAGGTQRLPRLIGVSRAKEMIFTGRAMSAKDAQLWGLVDHVTNPGQTAFELALELAGEMQNSAPLALRSAKEAIEQGMQYNLADGLAREQSCYERLLGTEDRREALEAFRERRSPVFEGR